MQKRSVEIAWMNMSDPTKAPATVKLAYQTFSDDLEICENLYAATNTYKGSLWLAIHNILPSNRSHTALSVGDTITIDDKVYVCAPIGFKLLMEANA